MQWLRRSFVAGFFVTVPFGLVSAWILARYVREEVEHKTDVAIDWQGATDYAKSK